jgi:hypothetical protein
MESLAMERTTSIVPKLFSELSRCAIWVRFDRDGALINTIVGPYKDDSTTLATIIPSAELKPSLRDKTAGSIDNLEIERQKQMLQMLNNIDQLQECKIDPAVSLPQLVVSGDGSFGKSSMLEAISGVPFPRIDKVCPRFETKIGFRGDSMKDLPDGSRAPTGGKKTDSFVESELSADWSHYPWHNKDLGDFGTGGNKTQKYITPSTYAPEKLDPSTSQRAWSSAVRVADNNRVQSAQKQRIPVGRGLQSALVRANRNTRD